MNYYQVSVYTIGVGANGSTYGSSAMANGGSPVFALLLAVDPGTTKVTWVDVFDFDGSLTFSGPPVDNGYGTCTFNPDTLRPTSGIQFPAPPLFKTTLTEGTGYSFSSPDQYISFSFSGTVYYYNFTNADGDIGSNSLSSNVSDVTITTTSCLSETCQILTLGGLRMVSELSPGDRVWNADNETSTIVKIWKSKVPSLENIAKIDYLECTSDHLIYYGKQWIPAGTRAQEFLPRRPRHVFQIQTDSYGVWSTDYIISTWTQKYIDEHPAEVRQFT